MGERSPHGPGEGREVVWCFQIRQGRQWSNGGGQSLGSKLPQYFAVKEALQGHLSDNLEGGVRVPPSR